MCVLFLVVYIACFVLNKHVCFRLTKYAIFFINSTFVIFLPWCKFYSAVYRFLAVLFLTTGVFFLYLLFDYCKIKRLIDFLCSRCILYHTAGVILPPKGIVVFFFFIYKILLFTTNCSKSFLNQERVFYYIRVFFSIESSIKLTNFYDMIIVPSKLRGRALHKYWQDKLNTCSQSEASSTQW